MSLDRVYVRDNDLLCSPSIVGPSSSHTVGPMRAGRIFINDLLELRLLEKVSIGRDIP